MRLLLFLLLSLPALAASNSITIKDTSNSAQTNRPFTISRVFAKGDIAHFPKAVIGGTQITTQADVKTRWLDGSVQHALVSFLANVGASASITVDFVDQASGNNTGQMDKAAILNANWGARIEATANSLTQAADARQIITDWNGQASDTRVTYWLKGPVCTQVVLEDQTMALQYDMGWDTYKPLHPIFVVTLYPGYTAGVKTEMILENEWTTKLEDQTYSLSLKTGKTNPTQVYSKANYLHAAKTRWRKVFWVGTAPKAVSIDHNLPYMISTQAVPNFDTSITLTSGQINSAVNAFNSSDKCDLGGHGLWIQYLPMTGGRPDIGTFPTWYSQYLFSMDAGLYNVISGLSACAGYNSNHLRESASGKKFDAAKQIDAFGKPISIDARPTIYVDLGRSDLTASGDRITPVGPTTSNGWTDDIAHQPGWTYIPYLITGDWYDLQELFQRAAAMLIFPAPNYGDYLRGSSWGYFPWAIQTRGQAWGLRDVAQAAFMAPDGSPEKAYFTEKINNNIEVEEGNHNIINGKYPPANPACPGYTAGPTASKWCYGRVTIGHNLANPLHFTNAGGNFTDLCGRNDPHFVPQSDPQGCGTSESMYMANYKFNVLGHIEELGFGITALNRVLFLNLLHILQDPAFNPFLAGTYVNPVEKKNFTYYQNWADVLSGFSTAWNDGCGHTYNLRTITSWSDECGGGGATNTTAPGYPHIAKGAASYLAGWDLNDGPLLGANAWAWMVANVMPVGNGGNPTYILLPRTSAPAPPQNKCDLNSDGKTDSLDIQLSILRVLGGTGTSTDTQRVINAALGAACP